MKSINKQYPREYHIWKNIRYRCNNSNYAQYDRYGGRGIKVCVHWGSFKNFIEDMGERPSSLHSIDRENNMMGYSPENCRWATAVEQAQNRRTSCKVSGVRWKKARNKWSVWGLWNNLIKKQVYIGCFTEEWDAICARKSWEVNIDHK